MIAAFLAAALTVNVTPHVAFSPATIRARAQLEQLPTARTLVIFLASAEFEQRSDIPIFPCGDTCKPTRTVWIPDWKSVPADDYVVTVIVVDQAGTELARAIAAPVHIAAGLGQ